MKMRKLLGKMNENEKNANKRPTYVRPHAREKSHESKRAKLVLFLSNFLETSTTSKTKSLYKKTTSGHFQLERDSFLYSSSSSS